MNRDQTPDEQLMMLLSGHWIAQAVSTVASLGVVEVLLEGARDAESLADVIGCDPEMLDRLLSVLVPEGLFIREGDRYALSELGTGLRREHLGHLAAFVGSPAQWMPWAGLRDTIRTGKSAHEAVHGTGLYQWLSEHPHDAALYNSGIEPFTREQARLVAEHHDFSNARVVVDVGAGRGRVLLEILARWPHLRGIVFDVPHVLDVAKADFVEAGVHERCEFLGGDFLRGVPRGGDVYLVKHVLHNWSDRDATTILSNIRAAISEHGQLLVIDGVLAPHEYRSAVRRLDLEMMVLFGQGRERTKQEFRQLFTNAGFRFDQTTIALGSVARLMLGHPN